MPTAYDYRVGTSEEVAAATAGRTPALFAGWAGPEGPAITGWPRSPRTGQPMAHCFTSWLPEEYRRREPDLVAVAVFQWFDEGSHEHPLTPHGAHGQIVGHPDANAFYALLRLAGSELTGPRTTRPDTSRTLATGEHDPAGVATGYERAGPLWLLPRDDPNAGLAPVDRPGPGDAYVDVRDRWERFGRQHLGGTFMNPDGPDHSFSPWYLEVDGLGGFDFAGGDLLAIDLDAPSPLGRPRRVVDVPFHRLAEWESTRHGDGRTSYAREVSVWIAFAHRLVAIGEADGPSTHAGVYAPHEALTRFPHFFDDDDRTWLRPHVERLAAVTDWRAVQTEALGEYARRHGGTPAPSIGWELER